MKERRFFLAVTATVALLTPLLALTTGCGGGSQNTGLTSGSTNSTTRVVATVQWPERSRDILAPSSAQSLQLILRGAKPDGSDFIFTIDRGDNDAAFTQEYTSPDEARTGEWDVEVHCQSAAGGGGDLVGEANLHTNLKRDGRPLEGPIALRGNIKSIIVNPGQEIGVGERKELRFTVRNEKGEILAVGPQAAVFTVVEGGERLRILERRIGEGLQVGEARVTVRVDDITSSPETVRVVSRVAISIRPEELTLDPGASETFTATVTGTDNKDVLWSIREGSPAGGTITDGGRYTAPATPGEYHVVATSKADPSKSAVAVVHVRASGEDNLRKVELPTNDLVWDPVSRRIWASVPSRAGGSRANSVTAIDPTTGQIGDSFAVGSEPDKLALRGDSQILWIGVDGEAAIRRFNISNRSTSALFPLGSDDHGRSIAEDIEVMPGKPETVAVARRNKESTPRHEGVVIYDNGKARERTTDRHKGSTTLAFSAQAGKLYGYNGEPGGDAAVRRMEVGDTGVTITNTTTDLFSGTNLEIAWEDNRLYSPMGRVINPETRAILGNFPNVGAGALVLPDSARGVVYFLTGDGATRVLRIFDRNTYQQIADRSVPGVSGKATSLVRWGENGLAFRTTDNQVFILKNVPGK